MVSQPGPASGRLNVSSPLKERGFHVRFSDEETAGKKVEPTGTATEGPGRLALCTTSRSGLEDEAKGPRRDGQSLRTTNIRASLKTTDNFV